MSVDGGFTVTSKLVNDMGRKDSKLEDINKKITSEKQRENIANKASETVE